MEDIVKMPINMDHLDKEGAPLAEKNQEVSFSIR
jgi:hypothetical protein